MENLDEKLKRIVMAGIGGIISSVEKSRDAIIGFAESELAQELAQKGEKAVETAVQAGGRAVKTAVDALKDIGKQDAQSGRKAHLALIARQVHGLSEDERAAVHAMVAEMDRAEAEAEKKAADETYGEDEHIGKPGVTDSEYDLDIRRPGENGGQTVNTGNDPLSSATPTAPDDDLNVKRSQTNNMNEHLKQSVPPDF